MVNKDLLIKAYKKSGVTITFLANQLHCSRNRVYSIMDGTGGECTVREVAVLSKLLRLTNEERDKIFFGEIVN